MQPAPIRQPNPLFYLVWLALGLIQAGTTELLDDEAYYWVFSQHLDWGYFDHPPMTALLIRAEDEADAEVAHIHLEHDEALRHSQQEAHKCAEEAIAREEERRVQAVEDARAQAEEETAAHVAALAGAAAPSPTRRTRLYRNMLACSCVPPRLTSGCQ